MNTSKKHTTYAMWIVLMSLLSWVASACDPSLTPPDVEVDMVDAADMARDNALDMPDAPKDSGLDLVFDIPVDDGGDRSKDSVDMPPPPALLEVYPLPGDKLFPESVTFDPARRSFFVGSLEKGNILQIHEDGRVEEFYAGTGEADRFTLGVKVDGDRLIVCSYLNAEPVTGRLWVFDLNTRLRTHDIDFAQVVENGSCSDIVTDDQGAIYVTDRELPNVYKVTLAQGGLFEAVLWAQDDLLAAPQLGIGQNGIALSADGRHLITTLFFPPTILRITIDDPADVRDIKIGNNDTSGDLFAGADGIVMVNGELFVAFGKNLLKLTSEDDWETATPHFVDVGAAIAAVTFAEGALYVLKSDIPKFVLGGELDLPFSVFRVPLSVFN